MGPDIAAALLYCQSLFVGSAFCDAIVGGKCHYTYTNPECYDVERVYYAPGGIADQNAASEAEWRSRADETIRRALGK